MLSNLFKKNTDGKFLFFFFLIFVQTWKTSDFTFVIALFCFCYIYNPSASIVFTRLPGMESQPCLSVPDLSHSVICETQTLFMSCQESQTFKSWQKAGRKKLISQLISELVAAKTCLLICALTSCGTWMKAKVYSVACAGRFLVLKAGGMAARRVLDTTSLWGRTQEGHLKPGTQQLSYVWC